MSWGCWSGVAFSPPMFLDEGFGWCILPGIAFIAWDAAHMRSSSLLLARGRLILFHHCFSSAHLVRQLIKSIKATLRFCSTIELFFACWYDAILRVIRTLETQVTDLGFPARIDWSWKSIVLQKGRLLQDRVSSHAIRRDTFPRQIVAVRTFWRL